MKPEAIDAEEEEFKKVAQMSTDLYTIKQAKAQGIDPTSNDFNNFVAAKALVTSELEDAQEVSNLAAKNLGGVIQETMEAFLTSTL